MMETLSNRTEANSSQNINPILQEDIQTDNISFYQQYQVHQESIFEFIYEIFDKIKPVDLDNKISLSPYDPEWSTSPHLQKY